MKFAKSFKYLPTNSGVALVFFHMKYETLLKNDPQIT